MHTQQQLLLDSDPQPLELDPFRRMQTARAVVDFADPAISSSPLLALNAAITSADYGVCLPPAAEHVSFPTGVAARCKRTVDMLGALAILFLFLPLLGLCAALVLVSSPGPLFYKHPRLGRGGREFLLWKFRSMRPNADHVLASYLAANPAAQAEWVATQKLKADPRVFSVGRFMRRFSLDELPQLWNVLRGDMSLVGPRPIVANEVHRYGQAIRSYYAFRPGMTGLWQVSGRNKTPYSERVELDRRYVQHWSLRLDLAICFKTFRAVVSADGAY